MASVPQPVRGTHDILPDQARRHRAVVEAARASAARAGYQAMDVPIFEFSSVFRRTLGESSDIVTKEMYTFKDRSGESITLRPEATAGVARAFLSGRLAHSAPCKFFYSGPMFRYERPQKGRQRQFNQVGIELIGVPEPLGDVEIIAVGARFLEALNLTGTITLRLNTLGDAASRDAYRDALLEYLLDHKDRLSADSRERLERNPLRTLDSKHEGDQLVVADAPVYSDYLNPASRDFFAQVRGDLDALGIAYVVDPRLVRGLDYYCHTAFEFVSDALGAQATVLGGGRYDGLIGMMGGPPTPGVGWAAGVERLAMVAADPAPASRPVVVAPVAPEQARPALVLVERLRGDGLVVEIGYRGNMKKRMKQANRINARAVVILGEDEMARGAARLRDLDSGEERDLAVDRLADALRALGC